MKKSLSFVVFLLSQVLWAQPQSASEVRVIEPHESNVVVKGTSEHNRVGKKFGITLATGTFGPAMMTGFSGQYFIDRNQLIRLDVAGGKAIYTDILNSLFGSESKTDVSNVTLSYQRFFGNSFYVRGGLGLRKTDYLRRNRGNTEGFFTTLPYEWKFQGTSVDALATLGNEWQWSNFTLGVDWIGIAVPVSSKTDSESFIDSSSNNQDYYDMFKKDQETLTKKQWGYLLNIRLGASF